ncbi:hypothetical protein F2Q69_00029550 [Brassica cretica]|uniref:Uncharacterized protein n=1 Tax=Brassica cretica TaxID=69181 RepID=A0A8S9S444_BRACR|nr:hypothetical protein F2Q69_00029550 [Brassica cretica]
MSNSSMLLGDLKAGGVDNKVMQFALCSSTSDEVHHAIFKASKLLHGDDELLITDMPKEEVESLFDAYEDSDFARTGSRNDVSEPKIRLRPRLAILIKTLLKKNVYQEQGKLETKTVPDKACNGTSIFGSSEESKMSLDVRMCNGNGFQGVSVGLADSMIYAPTIKKDYVGRRKLETKTVPDKACNGTSIFGSSEESKMSLDVRMCNGNGFQGVSVGLADSMIYAPTIKKDYVGRKQDSDHDQGENQKLSLYQALSLKTLLADYLLLIAYEVKCMNNKKASFCIPRIG